jgi:hydrogenase maturation protein HypF
MSSSIASRLKLTIRGAVQGVGFRPFIYRLASELNLRGWVNNSTQGVFVEAEGTRNELEKFLLRVSQEKPPRSFIQSLEASWLDPVGYTTFEIHASEPAGSRTTLVMPDIATCSDCLQEVFDPNNRRYRYAFTNCTNCGPRFSIIQKLPYDRVNTSMQSFRMCARCQSEYDDPCDRRFHAQPNACPACGPQLELWGQDGRKMHRADFDIVSSAAEAIRQGNILAVKGLGGFHLMVAADNEQTLGRLRERKHREEKPFALMFPSVTAVKEYCEVSPLEERLLCSPEAPIVLLHRQGNLHSGRGISRSVAPGNPYLGAMLPYTPLHHLLLAELKIPVVATSGNLSDEPICIDEHEAVQRLGKLADFFLVHNRPIVRHVDDSVARVMLDREQVLRRARGFAPLPIELRNDGLYTNSILAVGAHLKNSISLAIGSQAFISQHIGDLETEQAFEAFRRVIEDFESLYETRPTMLACDAHPDYLSTKFAQERSAPAWPSTGRSGPSEKPETAEPKPALVPVQHHIAHILSCMAENELEPPVLGISWDGTGYGLDGTVWGGEFFVVNATDCQRVAHLRQFRLPGGEQAVREPRRVALGLLYELFGEQLFAMNNLLPVRAFSRAELLPLKAMLARGINSPLSSSGGRLFDGVASLVGLRQRVRFEGQAAIDLEFAIQGTVTADQYDLPIVLPSSSSGLVVVDWAPMLETILPDVEKGKPIGEISAKFHNALVETMMTLTRHFDQERVVLSGGCFQNRYLTEHLVRRLQSEGFRPYWHQRVPPNDGGICLGQICAALRAQDCSNPARSGVSAEPR